MPILDLQRRMVEAGRIRAGDKGDKGQPQKLANWRLTSKDRVRLQAAAKLWGGEVKEWVDRAGEFELYTETDTLPIMVGPETQASLWYELYSAGGVQRRCEGNTEMISDSPCLCNEDERQCKPSLRFGVLLPDLVGIGSWLVISHGYNAAREIPGTLNVLSQLTSQGLLLPARLRLEQRHDVKAGQTRRYAVPVIDLDVSFRELLGAQGGLPTPSVAALPSGFVPVAGNGGSVSLAEGIAEAETQTLARKPRVELPEDDDILDDESGAPSSPPAATADTVAAVEAAPRPPKPPTPRAGTEADALTAAQKKFLGYLVRLLRDEAKAISTENLWAAMARSRNVDVETMVPLLGGQDADGVLHFGPLLASMTRAEASELIDRLLRLEENLANVEVES